MVACAMPTPRRCLVLFLLVSTSGFAPARRALPLPAGVRASGVAVLRLQNRGAFLPLDACLRPDFLCLHACHFLRHRRPCLPFI